MLKPELIQGVIELTGRPDRGTQAKLAVQAALLELHQKDFFPQDLTEVLVTFAASNAVQTWTYRTSLPRFRAISYMTAVDGNLAELGTFHQIEPLHYKDQFGEVRDYVWYLAGENIQMRASVPFQQILVAAYQLPDVSDATFSSWVAANFPYAVIYLAASKEFRAMGDASRAREVGFEANNAANSLLAHGLTLSMP